MKVSQRVSLCFLLFLILGITLNAVDKPNKEVLMAARTGLDSYLPLILSPEVISTSTVQLGYGFPEYTVAPERLLADNGESLWEKTTPTGAWRFVILKDGQPIALLTVDKLDGLWQAVNIGALQLANEVQSVVTTWPEENGFQYRFIRIFQAKADFMAVKKETEEPRYAPLIAARVALQIESIENEPLQRLYQSEIMEPLQDIVLNALGKHDPHTQMELKEN